MSHLDPDRALRRHALVQAMACLLLLAAAGATAGWSASRPAGDDEVRDSIAELRSQAAELRWLADHAGGELPPRFLEAHARQLAEALDRTRDRADSLHPEARLQPLVRSLLPRGAALSAAALDLQTRTLAKRAAAPDGLRRQAEALERAELALKR